MSEAIRIGILYSTRGPYGAIGADCRDGAAFAVEWLRSEHGIRVEPVFADPEGDPARYIALGRALLRDHGCRHVVGTVLSAARKDIIPLVEKYDGLLWYICPYEGFEANENVIYTGACPNQHLLPLFDYLIPRYGKRVYLLGANYVWGWEMNRIARELLGAAGGEVLGERYLPLEETEVDRIVADIERLRPDFILNNFIGPASYAFLAAMHRLAQRSPAFGPQACPVVSCDLTECELGELAPGIGVGQLSAASYFDSLDTPANLAFKAALAGRAGLQRPVSSFLAGAFTAVDLCARAVARAGTDEPSAVRSALHAGSHETVFGPLRIDSRTNHAALPFHLGRITEAGGFAVIASAPAIAADPYLSGPRSTRRPSHLRVAS